MSYHTKNFLGGDFGVGKKRIRYHGIDQPSNGIGARMHPIDYHVHTNNVIFPTTNRLEEVVHFHTKHVPEKLPNLKPTIRLESLSGCSGSSRSP